MSEADRYRLEPMRDLRAAAEHTRRGELASAVGESRAREAELAQIAAKVTSARAAVASARAALQAVQASRASATELVRADAYVARRRRDLEAVIGELARARASQAGQLAEVEAARAKLAIARADRELIERHFARWRDQRAKLASRRED